MEEDTQAASHAQRPEASSMRVKTEEGQDANRDSPKGVDMDFAWP